MKRNEKVTEDLREGKREENGRSVLKCGLCLPPPFAHLSLSPKVRDTVLKEKTDTPKHISF